MPVIVWILFAYSFYGSPIPGTLLAKRAEASLSIWPNSSFDVITHYVWTAAAFAGILFAAGAICGTIYAIIHRDLILNVAVWAALHLAAYSQIGVTFWNWYATPLVVAYFLLAGYGIGAVIDLAWTNLTRLLHVSRIVNTIAASIALAVFAYAGAGEFNRLVQQPPLYYAHIDSFGQVVSYLHRESPNGASISTVEPGALSYWLGPKYYVIDTLGLTSPGVADHILSGEVREWPYLHYRPDYVLVSYGGALSPDAQSAWFVSTYAEAAKFDEPTNIGIKLILYNRSAMM
jgi:hypothetical protein